MGFYSCDKTLEVSSFHWSSYTPKPLSALKFRSVYSLNQDSPLVECISKWVCGFVLSSSSGVTTPSSTSRFPYTDRLNWIRHSYIMWCRKTINTNSKLSKLVIIKTKVNWVVTPFPRTPSYSFTNNILPASQQKVCVRVFDIFFDMSA